MPFGEKCEYEDFDACVNANQDKEDPHAYCAVLQEQTETACAERRETMTVRHSYRSIAGYKARLIDRITALDSQLGNDLRNVKLDWYRIRNQEETDPDSEESVCEVFIYDEIGGSFGISAEQFVKDLQEIDTDNIDVRINSPGGSVFDAIAIYNALVKHPARITTYVEALAASAASIIAMAGDECVMMVGSQLMIHDALGVEMGNAKAMREIADFLDRQSDNIASIYAVKAGGDNQQWRDLMLAETWMFANEAVDFGLADRVYTAPTKSEDMPPDEESDDDEMMPDESEDEGSDDDEDEISALMSAQHRLTNRGFRFSGRKRAPKPTDTLKAVKRTRRELPCSLNHTDDEIDAFIAALDKTLGRI